MNNLCFGCFRNSLNANGICAECGYDNVSHRANFPLALPAGSILYGRYILGKVLGQGGYGITYLAQDYQTKDLVAIKEFFPDTMVTRTDSITVTPLSGARGENFQYGRTAFLEEAKTMAAFNQNPHVAGVQMYFEENNTGYYVMEYVDGTSFQQYIRNQGGRLSWEDTYRIIMPVIDALEDVHSKGIIHRDVAPDNIYITKDGNIKLLDFGAARHSLGNVSQSLDVILKHGFAPKEQYSRRGRQGPYTDVYALCATIYFALTGAKPDDAIDRSTEDTMPPPTIIGARITPEIEDVILKGLSVEIPARYPNMVELRKALLAANAAAVTGAVPFTPVDVPVSPSVSIPVSDTYDNGFRTHWHSSTGNDNRDTVTAMNTNGRSGVSPEETLSALGSSGASQGAVLNAVRTADSSPDAEKTAGIDSSITATGAASSEQIVQSPKKIKALPKWLIPAIAGIALLIGALIFYFVHPHSYGNWTVTKEPTCTETGMQMRKCYCGHIEEQILAVTNHTPVADPGRAATCQEGGLTQGSHCSVCNVVIVKQKATAMVNHTPAYHPAVASTCTAEGKTAGSYCSVCNTVLVAQESIPKKSHTIVETGAKEATCTSEGSTGGKHCSVCNTVIEKAEVIPKKDHKPVTDKAVAATCQSKGKTEGSHCSVCNKVLKAQEDIPKKDHKPVTDKAVAATCQSEGKTEGSHCSVCNTVIVKQNTIPKTSHTLVDKAGTAATCTTSGKSDGKVCSVCGYSTQTSIPALGHDFQEGLCDRCNTTAWYVSFSTTQYVFSVNTPFTISFTLYNRTSNSEKTVVYYNLKYSSSSGTSSTSLKVLDYGVPQENGDGWDINWNSGISSPQTGVLYIYDEYKNVIGSFSFSIQDNSFNAFG